MSSLLSLVQGVSKNRKMLNAISHRVSGFPLPSIPKISMPPVACLHAAQLMEQAQAQREYQIRAAQTLSHAFNNTFTLEKAARVAFHAVGNAIQKYDNLDYYPNIFEQYEAAAEATRGFYKQEQLFSRSFILESFDVLVATEAAEAAVHELKGLRNDAIHSIDQLIEGLTTAELSTLDCINLGVAESLENYYDLVAESLKDEHDEVGWIIGLLKRLKENVNETWAGIVRLRHALKDKSRLIDCSCTALSRFARRTRAMSLPTHQLKFNDLPYVSLPSVFIQLRGYLMQLHSLVVNPPPWRQLHCKFVFRQRLVATLGLRI